MAAVWNRFFKRGPGQDKILETLPEEILVDGIIGLLDVKEILKLRQVSRSFALLTKNPTVWKRFLPLVRKMPQPLAPLPPTSQYSARNISSMDIEHIVTKAVSLDDNLRSNCVRPWFEFQCLAYGEVSDMVLLPGGHFLITAVTYRDGRNGIMFWVVKHPASGTPSPLFYRETEVKAYALQAKYMTVKGKKGICISFLRKRHKKRGDTRDIPENAEMGGKEDPEDPWMPLKYECTTIHVSLRCIEMLTDRRIYPQSPEFDKTVRKAAIDPDGTTSISIVSRIRTGTQLGVISLDVIQDRPYVSVVKRPDRIVLECLDDGERSILHCLPNANWPGRTHSIWNFRVLPDQNQILTFRSIDKDDNWSGNYYLIDLFGIPRPNEQLTTAAVTSITLRHKQILNVQISPSNVPTIQSEEDPSLNPYLFENGAPPPPISLYLRMPDHLEHHSLWPIHVDLPASPPDSPQSAGGVRQKKFKRPGVHYFYDLQEHWIIETGGKRFGVKQSLRTLPGAYNAFMYEVPNGYRSTTPPVRSLWSYIYKGDDHTRFLKPDWMNLPQFGLIHPDLNGGVLGGLVAAPNDEHEVEGLLMQVDNNEDVFPTPLIRGWRDKPNGKPSDDSPLLFRPKDIRNRKQLEPIYLIEEVAAAIKKGISAICWDEHTGRVIIATLDRRLRLMDFAYTRHSDSLDIILNRNQDMAIEGENERLAILDQAGAI